MDEPVINPIVDFKSVDDFVVWGAKTLPRQPVAMDRVGVRRLCVYLEKQIRKLISAEKYAIHHNPKRFTEVMEHSCPKIEQFLEDCRLRKAFESFSVGTFTTEDKSEVVVKFKRPEAEALVLSFFVEIDSTFSTTGSQDH